MYITPSGPRRLVAAAVLAAIAFACQGCASNRGPGHTASDAKATATAADQRLAKDGYAALHVPGFGRMDLGFRNTGPRYEGVYIYTGSDLSLVGDMVASANQKVAGDNDVVIIQAGNLIVVRANSLSDLEKAGKAVLAAAK